MKYAMTYRWVRFSRRLVLVLTPKGSEWALRTDGHGRVLT